MQLSDLYHQLKTRLAGVHDPAYEARLILEEVCNVTWADIIAGQSRSLDSQGLARIDDIVDQRISNHKPLSRIFGVREFWGLAFELNESTLDPRPETEILVDRALDFVRDYTADEPISILDLGTGTGCIPISLLHALPAARALAVDVAPRALEAAAQNAQKNGVQDRLQLKESNWFDAIAAQRFDLITANPPYIDSSDITQLQPEVQKHDPILALDGGEKGLDPYKIIFANLKNHLNPQGRAFLEIGAGQCGYIEGIAEKYRIRILRFHSDYAGIPRVVEISCGDK